MIHQPLGGFQGQASDFEIHAKEILSIKEKLNRLMAQHTGQDYDTVARDTDRDNFLSATEAKEYGLIDQVLTNRSDAAATKQYSYSSPEHVHSTLWFQVQARQRQK